MDSVTRSDRALQPEYSFLSCFVQSFVTAVTHLPMEPSRTLENEAKGPENIEQNHRERNITIRSHARLSDRFDQ